MSHSTEMETDRTCIAGPFRVREVRYAGSLRQDLHAHAFAGVTMVLAGAIRETAIGVDETASSLSIVVKPVGFEHRDEVGPEGSSTLQIVFAASVQRELADSGLDLGFLRWRHGPPAVREMLTVLHMIRDGRSQDSLEDAVVAAIAAVTLDEGDTKSPLPGWVRRIREEVDDRPYESIRVRDLASAAGVHPVSLARAFRRHYGASITEYRKRLRVRRAAQMVAAGRVRLSQVAHASGYADQSHFCRDFRRTTGITPTEFRRLAGRD